MTFCGNVIHRVRVASSGLIGLIIIRLKLEIGWIDRGILVNKLDPMSWTDVASLVWMVIFRNGMTRVMENYGKIHVAVKRIFNDGTYVIFEGLFKMLKKRTLPKFNLHHNSNRLTRNTFVST